MRIYRGIASLTALLNLCCALPPATADEVARGTALLRRVAETRENTDTFKLSLVVETPQSPTGECLLEVQGGMRRAETLAPDYARCVVLMDDESVWIHQDGELRRMSMEVAAGKGTFCFDPRTIGVVMAAPMDRSLSDTILASEAAEYVEDVAVDGITCSVVRILRNDDYESKLWIHEPSTRIYRFETKSTKSDSITSSRSRFSTQSGGKASWMPDEVVEVHDGVVTRMTVASSSEPPDPSRFTLKAMGIPTGAAVVDYVMQRRIGYWDGDKIVDEYPASQTQAAMPPAPAKVTWLSTVTNRWRQLGWLEWSIVLAGWLIAAVMLIRRFYKPVRPRRKVLVLTLVSTGLLATVAFGLLFWPRESHHGVTFYTVDHYGETRDPAADLAETVRRASREDKRILIQAGADPCGWCRRLSEFVETNGVARDTITEHFLVMKATKTDQSENAAFFSQYPKITGYPHLFVLDRNGTFLHSQPTGELVKNGDYDPETVAAFLNRWRPEG